MPANFPNNIGLGGQPLVQSSRNSLFEVGLIIIICVLFSWFVILPKKASVDQQKDTLAKVTDQESQVSGKLAKLQSLSNSLQTNTQNINYLDQAIPLDGNVIRLRLLIQNLADSVGVTVGNINVAGSSGQEEVGNKALLADPYGASRKLQTLTGTLYVVGSFNQLLALLKKIESSGRLIDISQLNINQGTSGSLSMTINFNSYYFAP